MKKTLIHPPNHPKTMARYSPAVKVDLAGGSLLFVSGQIALDAQGSVVAPDDAGRQAEHVFAMLGELLEAGGMSFGDVVKTQLFLTDIKDYAAVSAVRNRYLAASRPASILVEVTALAKVGCRVEVDVLAIR